jgi:hypothetical protein
MSIAKSQREWLRNKMQGKYGLDDTPQNFDQDFTIADKILTEWGQNTIDAIKQNLIQSKRIASSDLLQSIDYKVRDFGDYVQLKLLAAPHYKFANDGRRGVVMNWTDDQKLMIGKRKPTAKYPPFDAISNWVRFKGEKSLSKVGTGFRTRQTSRVADKLKKVRLVNHLRYLIYKYGVEPTYFYTQVVNQNTINDLTKILLDQTGKQLVVNFKKVVEK